MKLAILVFAGIITTVPAYSKDYIVQKIKYKNEVAPKDAGDVVVDCAKNKTCTAVLQAAAVWAGIDPSYISNGATVIAVLARKPKSEEASATITIPKSFQFCRAGVSV